MKLILDKPILAEIVSDGVKEMLKRMNFSRGSRRNKWFMDLGQVLENYKKEMVENLISVIIEDFKGSIAVKVSNNKMEEKEIQEFRKFIEMVKKADASQYINGLKIGAAKVMEGRKTWTEEDAKELIQILNDGHIWILKRIDLYVRSEVFGNLKKLTEERSKL